MSSRARLFCERASTIRGKAADLSSPRKMLSATVRLSISSGSW